MNKLFIWLFKFGLAVVYTFLKLLPTTNKVVFISRQSDKPTKDFELLIQEIKKREKATEVVVKCRRLGKSLKDKLAYCFYLLTCLYHLATAKVCVIDTYCIPVSILRHKKRLKIIQIWHALGAIKKFGYQSIGTLEGRNASVAAIMKMHHNYTNVICASNETKKYYQQAFQVDASKILVFGMPRIDYMLRKEQDVSETIYHEYPILKEKKNILYVPTFRKEHKAKISSVMKYIDTNKYNLIIKLHPLDKTKINQKECIVDDKYNIFDMMKISDYIITDYSAISIEASVLNKPIYFYLYDIMEYRRNRGLNVDLFEEMPKATSTNIKKIIKSIEEDKYDYLALERFRNKYVETCDTQNTERITDLIDYYLECDIDVKAKSEFGEASKEKRYFEDGSPSIDLSDKETIIYSTVSKK